MLDLANSLRITEIFYSLQGESSSVGWPTVFVRLTGCPLRCTYCDTAYAFHGGERQSLTSIIEKIASHSTRFITVTGGEPLAQPACLTLLTELCDRNYRVSLETSGALSTADVDTRVIKILDLKTPGSGESDRNLYDNLAHLTPQDEVKFVLQDRADYDWAWQTVQSYALTEKVQVLFSPVYERLAPATLAEWILADQLPVRFQFQLHKQLWGEQPGK